MTTVVEQPAHCTERRRLLVIGASGFVGRYLLAAAEARGYAALGTQAASNRPGLAQFDLRTDRVADLLGDKLEAGVDSAWAAICGGIGNVAACGRDPEGTRQINVMHTTRLIDDLTMAGWRVVYFSTSAVFDGRAELYDESQTPAPLHEYGRQKAAVEEYVLSRHPTSVVARLSKAVSTDPTERQLFVEWVTAVRGQQPIACVAGESFSPTATDDIARAVLALVEGDCRGLYHVANQESFPRDRLARLFLETWGQATPVVNYPAEHFGFTEPRPACSCLSNTKLVRATGVMFQPMSQVVRTFCERLNSVVPKPMKG